MLEYKHNSTSRTRLVIGLLITAVGVLYLLDNLDLIYFNLGDIIFSWPMVFTVIGLIIMVNSRNRFFGTALFLVGLFFLLPKIFPGLSYDSGVIWPIIIIILGLSILLQKRDFWHGGSSRLRRNGKYDTDKIDEIAVFGGGEKTIRSDNFQGGNITSIFGGSEIDLSNCKLAEGQQLIDVLAIFGGSTLIVPKDWNVVVDVFPIFGGFSKKGNRMFDTDIDKSRTLVIKGVVIFGGGEVKFF